MNVKPSRIYWRSAYHATERFAQLAGVLTATWLLSAGAQASTINAFVSGDRLYELCKGNASGACTAYVDAVADVVSLPTIRQGICLPAKTSGRQIILSFQRYAMAHPDMLNGPAADLVIRGLLEVFPCRVSH
ncbi:Rap1a/Tai family immunity protein [Lichenicoccus sp.]|uniref:Rap1a/Tai family immunity protein n=1 Tax=Lichenicoccus sp. TaxID=2781899 RepID=UPI003D0AFE77